MTETSLIHDWVAPASMFALMFGMGLSLGVEDVRRVVTRLRCTLLGTALQVLAMPLVGLGLLLIFSLEPWLAAGLMITAALPGGLLSNMLTHLGRADTALSITLTTFATAIAIFSLPVWIHLGFVVTGAASKEVQLPILATAIELALLTLLPVMLGMWSRERKYAVARFEPTITRLGAGVLLVALVIDGQNNPTPSARDFAASFWPTLVLMLAALGLSSGLSRLLRLTWKETTTITIELCVKNSAFGLYIAIQSLDRLQASVPILIFAGIQIPLALALVALYNLRLRKRDPEIHSTA